MAAWSEYTRFMIALFAILTAINQGDVILAGDATAGTALKTVLNYCVPFIVSNLGLLAGRAVDQGIDKLRRPTTPRGSVAFEKP